MLGSGSRRGRRRGGPRRRRCPGAIRGSRRGAARRAARWTWAGTRGERKVSMRPVFGRAHRWARRDAREAPPRALAGPSALGAARARGTARRVVARRLAARASIAGGENEGSGGTATWLDAAERIGRAGVPSPRKPSITWRWASMISRVVRRYSSTAVSRSTAAGRWHHERREDRPQRAGRQLPGERAREVAVDEPGGGRQARGRSRSRDRARAPPAGVERGDVEGDARGRQLGERVEELLEAGLARPDRRPRRGVDAGQEYGQ